VGSIPSVPTNFYASVVELADTLALGASAARHTGSTPVRRTIYVMSEKTTEKRLLTAIKRQDWNEAVRLRDILRKKYTHPIAEAKRTNHPHTKIFK
jgi:hypothetical protein